MKTVKITDAEDEKCNQMSTGNHYTLKLRDLIEKLLPEDEKVVLPCDFNWSSIYERQQREEISVCIPKLSRFTTKYFERFVNWLNEFHHLEAQEIQYFDLELDIVTVAGYKVPKFFSRILVLLLRKYGDISTNSESKPEMKSVIFGFLCKVINGMFRTKLTFIT